MERVSPTAWPQGIRWLAGGITAAVLALAVAWVLFVPAADWLAHHDVGSAKGPLLQMARDAARGRLLTLGAGLFAAGALVFTVRNFTLSREGQVTATPKQSHSSAMRRSTCASAASTHWSASPATRLKTTRP